MPRNGWTNISFWWLKLNLRSFYFAYHKYTCFIFSHHLPWQTNLDYNHDKKCFRCLKRSLIFRMLEHPLAGPLFSGARYSKQTEVNNSFKKILIFSFQYLLILISLCSPRAYASQNCHECGIIYSGTRCNALLIGSSQISMNSVWSFRWKFVYQRRWRSISFENWFSKKKMITKISISVKPIRHAICFIGKDLTQRNLVNTPMYLETDPLNSRILFLIIISILIIFLFISPNCEENLWTNHRLK